MNLHNERGFTLVEILIVAGMLAVVMAAVFSLYYTNQRSAYVQEELADIQQNLRIAAENISRDVKMAGFLVPRSILTSTSPVALISNNTGTKGSDSITIYTMSSTATFATVSTDRTGLGAFNVNLGEQVDGFTAGAGVTGDLALIIRTQDRSQPGGAGNAFRVTAANRVASTITLGLDTGSTDIAPTYSRGDMIIKVDSKTPPSTIQYCLGPVANCGSTVTTCPKGQLCVMRVVNGTASVIAQNLQDMQFRYLLDDNTEVDAPTGPPYPTIRAVRMILTGQRVTSKNLSTSSTGSVRQIESVIEIRNR